MIIVKMHVKFWGLKYFTKVGICLNSYLRKMNTCENNSQ